jgi:molybdopterin converting factor subunit 1
MKVLFFAQSRQATGCADYLLKTDGPLSVDNFWALLISAFPDLAAQQKTTRLARNESYLEDDELLQPDDEVAVIPPVSGG